MLSDTRRGATLAPHRFTRERDRAVAQGRGVLSEHAVGEVATSCAHHAHRDRLGDHRQHDIDQGLAFGSAPRATAHCSPHTIILAVR